MNLKEIMGKILDTDGWNKLSIHRLSCMLCVRPMEIGKSIKMITGQKTVRHFLSHTDLLAEMKGYKDWESRPNWFFSEALDVSEQTIATIRHKETIDPSFGLGRGYWSKCRTIEQKRAFGSAPRKKKSQVFKPIVTIEKPVVKEIEKPIKKTKEIKEYSPCFCGNCPLGKQSAECYSIEVAGRPLIDPSLDYLNSKSFC